MKFIDWLERLNFSCVILRWTYVGMYVMKHSIVSESKKKIRKFEWKCRCKNVTPEIISTHLLFFLSPDTFHHITRNGSKLLWSKQPKWDEIIFEVALFSFCVKIHLFFSNKIAYKTTSTVVSEKTLTQNEL